MLLYVHKCGTTCWVGSLLGPEPLKKVASSPQLPKVPQTRAGVHEPLSHPSGDLLVLSRVKTEWGVHSCNPSLGRSQQEDRELEASLNYTNIACLRYVCMWVCILNFLPR